MLSSRHTDALRDTLRDVLLAAGGVFFGSLQTFGNRIQAMVDGNSGTLTFGQVIEIGLPLMSLAVFALVGILLLTSKRADPAADLARAIRDRTKTVQT